MRLAKAMREDRRSTWSRVRCDELFRPALVARKAGYADSMSSVPIRTPMLIMSTGTGSIRLSHMAMSLSNTRHYVSSFAVIGANPARAASWLLQCSN
jgi:hypothetical protein